MKSSALSVSASVSKKVKCRMKGSLGGRTRRRENMDSLLIKTTFSDPGFVGTGIIMKKKNSSFFSSSDVNGFLLADELPQFRKHGFYIIRCNERRFL